MGLDWSAPRQLANRLDIDSPEEVFYRLWYEDSSSPLAYIGESGNIRSRLYDHEKTYGGEALFSCASRTDLDAPHRRAEVETDLISAY